MTVQVSEPITTVKEQRFTLPGSYTWEHFEAIESLMANAPGLRITYYEQISRSEFLPDLDIALLVRCVQMSDILAARTEFMNGMPQIG